jgi:hypothetical protein
MAAILSIIADNLLLAGFSELKELTMVGWFDDLVQ